MLMKINFRVVILSEASAGGVCPDPERKREGRADAESKDLYSPSPAPAAERLSGSTLPQRPLART
jgi:hypothetical protein